jgi:hypothetical protein
MKVKNDVDSKASPNYEIEVNIEELEPIIAPGIGTSPSWPIGPG